MKTWAKSPVRKQKTPKRQQQQWVFYKVKAEEIGIKPSIFKLSDDLSIWLKDTISRRYLTCVTWRSERLCFPFPLSSSPHILPRPPSLWSSRQQQRCLGVIICPQCVNTGFLGTYFARQEWTNKFLNASKGTEAIFTGRWKKENTITSLKKGQMLLLFKVSCFVSPSPSFYL